MPERRYRTVLLKLVALLVLGAFLTVAASSLRHLFAWPSLDFLQQSRSLLEDPVVETLQESVAEIKVLKKDFTRGQGSGFNIAPHGSIVTNRHVVKDALAIEVFFPGLGTYEAESWTVSDSCDIALIELRGEGLPFIELEKEAGLEAGDEVVIIGSPRGYTRTAMKGKVLSKLDYGWKEPVLQIEAPIQPGSSGSPVFNQNSRAAAVIFASSPGKGGESRYGLAIPVKCLQHLQEK